LTKHLQGGESKGSCSETACILIVVVVAYELFLMNSNKEDKQQSKQWIKEIEEFTSPKIANNFSINCFDR
jgi:hypothetical protein